MQKAWVQIAAMMLSGNSLRQTVRTSCASVHQAEKLVAALLRVRGYLQAWRKVVAAYCRVYHSHHLQADCQELGSALEPYAWQSSMGYLYLFLPMMRLMQLCAFGCSPNHLLCIGPTLRLNLKVVETVVCFACACCL